MISGVNGNKAKKGMKQNQGSPLFPYSQQQCRQPKKLREIHKDKGQAVPTIKILQIMLPTEYLEKPTMSLEETEQYKCRVD